MNSCALAAEHVSEVLRDLWGTSCQLQDLRDLNDGFAKKTYLLQLRNPDMQCILHIWSKPDHQLTEIETDTDWILGPSGSDLFRVNTEFLRSHGVPTPELFFLDDTKTVCEYDFALVEYIEGGNFTDHNQQCGAGSTQLILDRINEMLMILHAMTAPSPGLLTQRRPRESRCERLVWEHVRPTLDLACEFNESIRSYRGQILVTLQSLLDAIEPRSVFSLIHGELGPEHIIVSPESEPYFIDCEGVRYFDLEFEHSLLRARFGSQYGTFERTDLDPNRMKLYALNHSIGWTAFASEAVTGDSVDREWATSVMISNTREVIRLVSD